AGLALSLLIALYQGWLVAYLGVPSFVVTLGGLMSFRGVAFLISDGRTQPVTDADFLLIGGGLVLGISAIRSCALRVALHPAGFLLAATYPGDRIWFSMLIAWALKSILQRLGGYRAMRTARPYVYGMVVGDALAALVWIVVGWWLRNPDQRYFILPP
ncbi:MAG TPA: hypothetical protein PLQ54_16850, partial [Armatimonadota bacterium]|nr:hypothetical protein [Armatimonadota bacterium]